MATLVANDLFVTSAVQDHDLGLAHGITPSALRRALEAAAREGQAGGSRAGGEDRNMQQQSFCTTVQPA